MLQSIAMLGIWGHNLGSSCDPYSAAERARLREVHGCAVSSVSWVAEACCAAVHWIEGCEGVVCRIEFLASSGRTSTMKY